MNILFFLTPKSDIAYIFENETLRQTLEKMEHRKFSCIPILNPDGKYVGTISEGDLLWGMKNLNITDMKAAEERAHSTENTVVGQAEEELAALKKKAESKHEQAIQAVMDSLF